MSQAQIFLKSVKRAMLSLKRRLEKCTKGKRSRKACIQGTPQLIQGIAFPTAISPNNTVAHLSPIASEPEAEITLKAGDVVKISLGAHIDGFAGVLADTTVIPEEGAGDIGRKADVLMAAWLASEAAIRLVKPGNKNYAVTDAVAKIAAAFGCKPLEGMSSYDRSLTLGMLSHQQARNEIAGKKTIILNPTTEQKNGTEVVTFAEGVFWYFLLR